MFVYEAVALKTSFGYRISLKATGAVLGWAFESGGFRGWIGFRSRAEPYATYAGPGSPTASFTRLMDVGRWLGEAA